MVSRNAQPAAGFIHPKAADLLGNEGEHDAGLDMASDSSPNYLAWIARLCEPHLGHRVLEVGAGIGSITELYHEGREVVANDQSEACAQALQERFGDVPNVTVDGSDLRTADFGEPFDSILMVNVLEHMEQDADVLRGLSKQLRPGGTIVIYVPALNGLYGNWDHAVGHYRRYSRWRLTEVFKAADLDPVHVRWANVLAIPAWAAFSRSNVSDQSGIGNKLALWDKTAIPVTRGIESRVRMPIGLNVLGVGQRPR